MIDLDDYSEEAIELRNQLSEMCEQIIDNKWTLQQASDNLCIPKSTIHNWIHTYVKTYFDEEYQQIVRILNANKRDKSKAREYWKRQIEFRY